MAVCANSSLKLLKSAVFAGATAVLLAACASTGDKTAATGKKAYKDAVGAYTSPAADPSSLDPVAAAAFWGTRYNRDQSDPVVAVNYAAALRKIGSVDEAAGVMSKAATQFPDNADVALEAGKSLIEAGRAFEAVRYLEDAARVKSDDWAALSAYGVALDQIGEHQLARVKYDAALAIAPSAVNVLNNKALSYALSGDLDRAELLLRTATGSRHADARMRQNLALVLALRGDMREAERLARSDLPPRLANQNIAYFRSLMNQPAYWSEFVPDEIETPEFSAPEPAPAPKPKAAPTKQPPLPKLKEETPAEAPKVQAEVKEKTRKRRPVSFRSATPVTKTSTDTPPPAVTTAPPPVPITPTPTGAPTPLTPTPGPQPAPLGGGQPAGPGLTSPAPTPAPVPAAPQPRNSGPSAPPAVDQ